MTLKVGNAYYLSQVPGINSAKNSNSYKQNITFGNSPDIYESNLPERFMSATAISKRAALNPYIMYLTAVNKIPYQVNADVLSEDFLSHCKNTREISASIYEVLPPSLKTGIDIKCLKDAAYLHDIGKTFIPQEIYKKKGALTQNELKIMQLHPIFSYELLKYSNIDYKTLQLIKNHHQDILSSGYPKVERNFKAGIDLQILGLADRYSALTEKRVYKEPLTREQALTIINNDVKAGKFDPRIFNALVLATAKNNAYSSTTI